MTRRARIQDLVCDNRRVECIAERFPGRILLQPEVSSVTFRPLCTVAYHLAHVSPLPSLTEAATPIIRKAARLVIREAASLIVRETACPVIAKAASSVLRPTAPSALAAAAPRLILVFAVVLLVWFGDTHQFGRDVAGIASIHRRRSVSVRSLSWSIRTRHR
jgi:hypothetical protein